VPGPTDEHCTPGRPSGTGDRYPGGEELAGADVAAYALAFAGAYALVRQAGAGRVAGAVAGIGWAFAPWRLARSGHLNVLSTGGIALCLAMLARGHGWTLRAGRRPGPERPAWALAGWAVAAWQVSLGFGIGLPLAYVLLGGCLAAAVRYGWVWWRHGRREIIGRRLLAADLGGAALFGLVCLVMGGVYLRVVALNPQARRDLSWTRMFSPPVEGHPVAPADSWLWGDRFAAAREQLSWPPEMALMPGLTLVTLGVLGLVYSAFRARYRILLGAGLLVSGALVLGSNLGQDGEPCYLTLSRLLPAMVTLHRQGYDQVVARRDRRGEHPVPRMTARLFYRAVNRWIDVRLDDGAGTPPCSA
jgi:hypothetical protein